MEQIENLFKRLCINYKADFAASFCGNVVKFSLRAGINSFEFVDLIDCLTVCVDHSKVDSLQMRLIKEVCPELVQTGNPLKSKEMHFTQFFLNVAEHY